MKRYYLFACMASALLATGCVHQNQTTPPETTRYLCSDNNVYTVSTRIDQNQAELLTLTLPNGQNVTLVNVVAGSGAKYVGSIYEWWSKGNAASFSNLDTQLECRTVEN